MHTGKMLNGIEMQLCTRRAAHVREAAVVRMMRRRCNREEK